MRCGLEVQFGDVRDESGLVVWGFARRRDAELAKDALEQWGPNWNSPDIEGVIRPAWCKLGGREAAMKYICERLQW